MNVLICEDEAPARKQISKNIKEVYPDVHIVAAVETGEEALSVIQNVDLDLIFMDVELADGPCFETLDKVEIHTPVIFTTAYDEYALKAFKLNSIDYLVKPISRQDIESGFEKYKKMKQSFEEVPSFKFKREIFQEKNYKERFLVKLGRKLFPLNTNEIAYFMASDKLVWLVTNEKKRYIVNFTLSELEEILDPEIFFRLNRQFITNVNAVKDLEPYFKGQVTVNLLPPVEEEIIISRNKTPELKDWLGV
ncbi:MAG: DNA-binding response regulator [Balneola sp.]|nr:DNA-binding response regulator [Balneola sp.]MBE78905.1 DNA-binding response regulator [Balneola sp.]|tara:strand:- start:55698 stop:56447 length:750 start_codon:yes stop_codon:yes gene_type:complete